MAVLPTHCLLFRDEDTAAYECDGLAAYRRLPLAVALPETEAQVQRVVQICARLDVPIVPRGAGTGLSGGAMPIRHGIVLSLARFRKIVEVDPYARTATVQPGVRNLAISEAAAPYGLYYAPDPSSQIACTIGGNVSENSGGVHCLKYGLTVHNVLRVRAVTMEGDVVEFGSLAPDAPGLDLLAVLIGSEGMFAIVTEITVKLIPKPQTAQVIMASFDDVVKGGNAVAAIIAAGIIPAGLEMMDKPATRAVEEFVNAGYDLDAAAILLCESDGTHDEVAEEIVRMTAVLREHGAIAHPDFALGSRAAQVLVGPQERVSGGGPHLAGLLLHGRHRAAPRDRAAARAYRRDGEEVRAALHQRVPRRRRQHASADSLQRQRSRRMASRGGVRLRHPGNVRRTGRHGDGRAWRGHREDQFDVRAVFAGRARRVPSRSSARSIRRVCSIPTRASRRARAAPSTARCIFAADCCRIPRFRASDF